MIEGNKYLDKMESIFGLKKPNPWSDSTYDEEGITMYHKDLEIGKDLEVVEFGPLDDPIYAIYDGGELKMTAYMSVRGRLYQAGAFDGEKMYGASNICDHSEHNDQWFEHDGYPCAEIAKEQWEGIEELVKVRV